MPTQRCKYKQVSVATDFKHVLKCLLECVQRFREVLEQMRAEAARTTSPGVGGTKKKMPQDLAVCLEALVRPFYISADAAPNVNKAKRAMWSLMMPILTPWSAENTITVSYTHLTLPTKA